MLKPLPSTEWIVLTGPPSSGKTTLISALAHLGYQTVSEASRPVFEAAYQQGQTDADLRHNRHLIQEEIYKLRVLAEERLPHSEPIFFDRAIPDSIGFCHHLRLPVGFEPIHRYKAVFFTEQLPFKSERGRIDLTSDLEKIGLALYQAYSHLGYQLIRLPPISVEERLTMIVKTLSVQGVIGHDT